MKKLLLTAGIILLSVMQIAYAAYDKQLEINKQNVLEFYDKAINQKDFEGAAKYLGPKFIEHDPEAIDGPEGLKIFIQFLRDKYPNAHSEFKRVFAVDDYVFLHVHSVRVPGTRGRAIFDLFRLENSKIVEHWHTVQDIPEKSANPNGMF